MEEYELKKAGGECLNLAILLDALLIKLGRLSHFMEHESYTRHDIFKKALIISFHSYFFDASYHVTGLVKRLNKKLDLLEDSKYIIEEPDTMAYVRRIWDDIFQLLENFEQQLQSSVQRFERGINTDYKLDSNTYKMTDLVRAAEKLSRPAETSKTNHSLPPDNSWFYDKHFLNNEEE